MRVPSYAGLMPVPIVTVWLESPGTISTVRVCVVASKAVELPPSELGFLSMVGSSLLTRSRTWRAPLRGWFLLL